MEIEALIGQSIVNRRKELGISQDELAQKSGVSRRYLSDLENGTRSVSVTVLKTLVAHLGWTLTDLMVASEPEARQDIKKDNHSQLFSVRLGRTIGRLCEEGNLSIELLARLIGLSQEAVLSIISGETKITVVDLEKVAIALRMTISELLLEVDKEK